MTIKKIFPLVFSLLFYVFSNAQETDSASQRGSLVIDVHPNITKLVKTKFSENYGDSYKIQLFYGGSRNRADVILNKFRNKFSQWPGKVHFETPNFKVWVGNYRTRLEADRALMMINKHFPSAFIFKPKK